MTPLHITLNGTPCLAKHGQTILKAAQENGVDIPTLCAYKDLPPFGGCRMCVVEVDGMRGFPTACTTPVEEGMVIRTETPALQSLRLETFNLLLSEHPLSCLVCPENGNCTECMITIRKGGVTTGCSSCPKNQQCELQVLAKRLGVEDIHLPVKYRSYPVEKFDPFYDRDYNLCVLCGRCVQVCDKLHFLSTLTFVERGPHAGVGTAFGRNHVDAGCSFCGACVDRCPTGTLTEKARKWEGVADNEIETTCPYCAAGCSIRLQVRKGMVIGSLPGEDPAINAGNLCVHGRFGVSEVVNHVTRMQKPWQWIDNHRFESSWEEIIAQAAGRLSACASDRVVVQVSTSLPDEDLYVAGKFAREVLHVSSNMPDEVKYISSLRHLINQTGTFESLRQADCVIGVGLDTRYSLSWLEYEFKMLKKNGTFLISINTSHRSLEQFVDVFVNASEEGFEGVTSDLLETLNKKEKGIGPIHQVVEALSNSQHPMIIVGADGMENPRLVDLISNLAQKTKAGVICLPLQGNLFGAIQSAAFISETETLTQPDVLYCIGDTPGMDAGFTIYQNAFASEKDGINIGLPSAVFTEREGTFTNAELRQRPIHKAVEPPGMALPDWQIITAIAKRMGASGFDFNTIEDIRQEMSANSKNNRWMEAKSPCLVFTGQGSKNDPIFMGKPLSSKVAGLRALLDTLRAKAGGQ